MLYLIKYGELALKKLNRPYFERTLLNNLNAKIKNLGKITKGPGRMYLESDENKETVISRLTKVFGVVQVCPAVETDFDMDNIKSEALKLAGQAVSEGRLTFKVETRRPNKNFPMTSPEVSAAVGEYINDGIPHLKVDVHNPSFTIYIEIREKSVYIYYEEIPCLGGLPLGTSGKACLLLSGGIDSPVAGWMAMKRGVEIIGVHFYSFPFTSERAKEKVVDLTRILAGYGNGIKLYVVYFTDIQKTLYEKCPQKMITILMRRMMMRIADRIADKENALALITGESIGQVASQTIESMSATESVTNYPVLRPVIGMDKEDIVKIAKKIKTYDTSILPYEDCCTVFVPKHPLTKPVISDLEKAEEVLDIDNMINDALSKSEKIYVKDEDGY